MAVLTVSEVCNLAAGALAIWLVQRITTRQSTALPAHATSEPLSYTAEE